MEALSEELHQFLKLHPSLELTGENKVKCTLNGHELPCRLPELKNFTEGKKYKRLFSEKAFDFSRFEPHIVPSTKNQHQLFCKLTLRHLNKTPEHVLKHAQGKRYVKALEKYEECQKQGVEYVPACLLQKKQQKRSDGDGPLRKKDMWEPPNDSDDSDSGDSMSDLYPDSMFKLKNGEDEPNGNVTSGGEEEMEVDTSTQNRKKRQQKQNGPPRKKFRNGNQKSKSARKSAGK
ncbi:surfeit locus protein 2 [Spea bombifrons]|uniref:surfeit locus protein 2 n=1 Tax=Spea bombifrons TaxID=233779 RepID=UPI002349297C|nr:surfeit locus protein 2 [Spea bombifrons]